jgi:hypothetical protein
MATLVESFYSDWHIQQRTVRDPEGRPARWSVTFCGMRFFPRNVLSRAKDPLSSIPSVCTDCLTNRSAARA